MASRQGARPVVKYLAAYLAIAAVWYWFDIGGPLAGEPPRPRWRRTLASLCWLPLAAMGWC